MSSSGGLEHLQDAATSDPVKVWSELGLAAHFKHIKPESKLGDLIVGAASYFYADSDEEFEAQAEAREAAPTTDVQLSQRCWEIVRGFYQELEYALEQPAEETDESLPYSESVDTASLIIADDIETIPHLSEYQKIGLATFTGKIARLFREESELHFPDYE